MPVSAQHPRYFGLFNPAPAALGVTPQAIVGGFRVYATRFTDEYGTQFGVALPDRYAKFANQGDPRPGYRRVCCALRPTAELSEQAQRDADREALENTNPARLDHAGLVKLADLAGTPDAQKQARTELDRLTAHIAELRHILSKNGGNLGETGCVGWMFERKGYFVVEKSAADEEKLLDVVLGAGADDMREDGSNFEILTSPENFEAVRVALEKEKIPTAAAEISMVPQNNIKLEGKNAQTMLKLMEALEDHEDIQNVWANFDIDESALEEAS